MENFEELDDFHEIEKEGAADDHLDISNIYKVIVGGFGEDTGLRTFFSSVKVEDLKKDVSFYEKLTKDKSWPVSQIIQREVDKIRVSNISKDYILGKGRLIKYFPPIVIAILPRSQDGKINLKVEFKDTADQDLRQLVFEKSIYRTNEKLKEYFLKAPNLSSASGLYALQISKVFDLNLLAWDKNKYYAIVIDGQHRLEALFKSIKEKAEVSNYKQDVVFLDFTELIRQHDNQVTPVEIVRRVFIDINTNAKKVGVVRQILMDDKDLPALIVQSLVESVNEDGTDKDESMYLKPEIVDWYGKSLKHQLPHLTGILSLYQIFNDYLVQNSLNSIDSLRSPVKVKKWVKSLNDTFFVDDLLSDGIEKIADSLNKYLHEVEVNKELEESIEDEYKESELFSYDYRILNVALGRFNSVFLESFVLVFNTFLPYVEATSILAANNGFDKDSELNEALIASPNKLGTQLNLRKKFSEIRFDLTNELNDNFQITYTVLFQKVLFSLLIQRITMHNSVDFTNDECLEVTLQFLSDINNLMKTNKEKQSHIFGPRENWFIGEVEEDLEELGTVTTSFWEGLIYENGNIIYNTQGIRTLTSVIDLFIECSKNSGGNAYVPPSLSEVPYVKPRIKRIIKKQYEVYEQEQVDDLTERVINVKDQFIKKYFDL